MSSAAATPSACPEPTWSTEPVYDVGGQRICALPMCRSPHSGKGLCKLHYKRWRNTGDPLQKSRFTSDEDKAAFIAADIATRRDRRARERERHEAEQARLRLWTASAIRKTRPVADALMRALDEMNEAERAAALELLVSMVLDVSRTPDPRGDTDDRSLPPPQHCP